MRRVCLSRHSRRLSGCRRPAPLPDGAHLQQHSSFPTSWMLLLHTNTQTFCFQPDYSLFLEDELDS